MNAPLTLAQKAARLHAAKPWLTHSKVMAELARRPRKHRVAPSADFKAVESPRTYAWQERKDLQ